MRWKLKPKRAEPGFKTSKFILSEHICNIEFKKVFDRAGILGFEDKVQIRQVKLYRLNPRA